jgi:hypothetical protein
MYCIIIGGAIALISCIILTIVFRDDLDPSIAFAYLFIFLICGFISTLAGIAIPITQEDCTETIATYELADISHSHKEINIEPLYVYNKMTKEGYHPQFIPIEYNVKPDYGKITLEVNKKYKTPKIIMHTFEKTTELCWSLRGVTPNDYNYTTVCVSPDYIYYEEEE